MGPTDTLSLGVDHSQVGLRKRHLEGSQRTIPQVFCACTPFPAQYNEKLKSGILRIPETFYADTP